MRGPHIFSSSRGHTRHQPHDPTGALHTSTGQPAGGRSIQSSDSPQHSIRLLHYHLDMLPFQERIRSTKEGTTRTAGQITQIGSKASQIAGGELRQTKGYLGKIPCVKESLYPHERTIHLYSFRYAHILRLFSKPPLLGENTLCHPGTFIPKSY